MSEVVSIDQHMAPLTAEDRTVARLAIVFGIVALTLAAIGPSGLSYGVTRRLGGIATRIALGAQRRRVVTMILRDTGGLVVAGLAIGGILAVFGSRLNASRLYGIARQDPLALSAATVVRVLGGAGCCVPPGTPGIESGTNEGSTRGNRRACPPVLDSSDCAVAVRLGHAPRHVRSAGALNRVTLST